jgi:hypothetical protein
MFQIQSVSAMIHTARFAAFAAAFLSSTAACAFFEWRFAEFFSNADGTVQFIELLSQGANEGQASGAQIRSTSTGKTVTLPQNLSGSTLEKRLLLATAGFGSLPGAVPPDFATVPLPPNFFNPSGDTVRLLHHVTIDTRTFPLVPADGVQSLIYPSNTFAPNSPTNFSNQTGSINLSSNFGDYNDDGTVNAADYVVFRKLLDTTALLPNDETPGWVMAEDHTVWRRRFGTSAAGEGAGSSAVPEPAAGISIILLIGLFCAGSLRHRSTR